MLLVIIVSIMAAFACRRMEWKLSGFVKTLLLMGMMISYVAFSLPQGLFLMTSFLEEAAVMDGCGIYRIIFQIITPMLKASIATAAIMTFLNNWNEFMMASTYLSSPKWKTLPFSVLVYILLNKHITKGVAMGAVKG